MWEGKRKWRSEKKRAQQTTKDQEIGGKGIWNESLEKESMKLLSGHPKTPLKKAAGNETKLLEREESFSYSAEGPLYRRGADEEDRTLAIKG